MRWVHTDISSNKSFTCRDKSSKPHWYFLMSLVLATNDLIQLCYSILHGFNGSDLNDLSPVCTTTTCFEKLGNDLIFERLLKFESLMWSSQDWDSKQWRGVNSAVDEPKFNTYQDTILQGRGDIWNKVDIPFEWLSLTFSIPVISSMFFTSPVKLLWLRRLFLVCHWFVIDLLLCMDCQD